MGSYLAVFVLAALNPFGGLFIAVPVAIFKLGWPPWLAVALSVPLAFVQVLAVDLLWERLSRWPWWVRTVEKKRSKKLTDLLARNDAKLWLSLFGVWIGPTVVTAVARYAGHSVHRVALPLLFGLFYVAVGTAVVCRLAPQLLE